jgi:hypothetical protein
MASADPLDRVLKVIGGDGWELAGVMEVGNQPHRQYRLIFKRPVEIEG